MLFLIVRSAGKKTHLFCNSRKAFVFRDTVSNKNRKGFSFSLGTLGMSKVLLTFGSINMVFCIRAEELDTDQ